MALKQQRLSRIPRSEDDITEANIPLNPCIGVLNLEDHSNSFIYTDREKLQKGVDEAHKSQDGLAERIQAIPINAAELNKDYSEQFNITRGFRQANVAQVDLISEKTLITRKKKEVYIIIVVVLSR